MNQKLKVGVLISGGGTNLQAIIDACESGILDAEIVFVGSDRPGVKGLDRAKKHNIPTFVVDYSNIIMKYKMAPHYFKVPSDFNLEDALSKQYLFESDADNEKVTMFLKTRAAAEEKLIEAMNAHPFDLLVLAGFMRNLTPYFIDKVNSEPYKPRIMNIHPAILPAFPGTDGYGDTFRYGCKVGGCTVHFIDYGEDSGPIIGQRTFPIDPDDTLDIIKQKGLEQEWILYPDCIQLFAENRIKVIKKTYDMSSSGKAERKVVKIEWIASIDEPTSKKA